MEKKDSELLCTDFKNTVEVTHGDYSHFIFQNAFYTIKKFDNNEMFLVWTEHCNFHAFFLEDLIWWREYVPENNEPVIAANKMLPTLLISSR